MPKDWTALVRRRVEEHAAVQQQVLDLCPAIAEIGQLLARVIQGGGQVLFCGNGGSAADALHLAGELSGRFYLDRDALPVVALGGNVAALTAIGNDYGYDHVFAREVAGLGREGDALVALSTSGNSPNVLAAMRAAGERGMHRIALTGESGGAMRELADHCLRAPSADTPRIQEMHMLMGHVLCEIVEAALFGEG